MHPLFPYPSVMSPYALGKNMCWSCLSPILPFEFEVRPRADASLSPTEPMISSNSSKILWIMWIALREESMLPSSRFVCFESGIE